MERLTTREIEKRIDQFSQRIQVLDDIIKEIKDVKAKATLKNHIASYKDTMKLLREELAKKNKRT